MVALFVITFRHILFLKSSEGNRKVQEGAGRYRRVHEVMGGYGRINANFVVVYFLNSC